MHGIRVLMAKNYIDNLSEEVKKGLHTKAAQKMWPTFAPPGYVNVVREDGKRIIVPDPVLGPMVTTLFQRFASGEYSLKTLARQAYEEGLRFRKSGNKIPVTTLHRILRKRIYSGEFDYAGITYAGSHEPLVTRDIWNRVQEVLDGRHRQRTRTVHDFAFSGFVRCGHCGCQLVGEVKKRRYVYYHCTGYRGKCGEPYTREEKLTLGFCSVLAQPGDPRSDSRVVEYGSDSVRSDGGSGASTGHEPVSDGIAANAIPIEYVVRRSPGGPNQLVAVRSESNGNQQATDTD